MQPFADHRAHVWCKLSGMITEADWARWSPAQIHPYIERTLDIFGAHRCMFGSDWPVCLLAGSYGQVIDLVRESVAALPASDQAAVFRDAAVAAYRLNQGRI